VGIDDICQSFIEIELVVLFPILFPSAHPDAQNATKVGNLD